MLTTYRLGVGPLVLLIVAAAACGPQSGVGDGRADQPGVESQANRVVTVIAQAEPVHLAEPGLRAAGRSVVASTRPFNAQLNIRDSRDNAVPYLAEALPKLNTDTWQVFPDGTMETRYTLKPSLTWHDGTPLHAEDFVFAWKVYTTPELGASASALRADISNLSAPDARTLHLQWKRLRPEAGEVGSAASALPRHILQQPFQTATSVPDAFIAHPYWTSEFIGLGPYKLNQWEPGAHLEGIPFAGHVGGPPKIGKIVLRWSADENTALANMLSGHVHVITDAAIRFEQGQVLKREWAASGQGVVLMTPSMRRLTFVQLRQPLSSPTFLTDLRVRQALAHSIDRQSLGEGLFQEEGTRLTSDTIMWPSESFHAEAERTAFKYSFDIRRSEQILADLGFARGSDGIFMSSTGERFSFDLQNQPGAQPERESTLMMETWRRAGIEARLEIQLSQNAESRHTFSGLHSAGSFDLPNLSTASIGTAANRYAGNNRAGWSNPEYDALVVRWDTTIDPVARDPLGVAMVRLYTQHLPMFPLFFNPNVGAFVANLQGPDHDPVAANAIVWNVHEWTFIR